MFEELLDCLERGAESRKVYRNTGVSSCANRPAFKSLQRYRLLD